MPRTCTAFKNLVGLVVLVVTCCLWTCPLEARLGAGIEVLESDESGVTLEVQVDSVLVTPVLLEGRNFHLIEFGDFLTTQEVGLPQLPYTSALLGIPFDKATRLHVVENQTATLSGVVPAPAPRPIIREGEIPTPGREFAMDQDFYSGGSVFPSEAARMGEPSTLRHQRVVTVFLFPFQYDPRTRELFYSTRLVVRVEFVETGEPGEGGLLEKQLGPERVKPGGTQQREPGPRVPSPDEQRRVSFEPAPSFELYAEGLYQGLLINYEDARRWRGRPAPTLSESPVPVAQAANEYKIQIDSTGIYKIAYASIPGLSPGYPIEQVRLFEKYYDEGDPSPFKQTSVPVDVFDTNSNGFFDGSDYFVFYGLSLRDRFPTDLMEHRYTYDNVYWLTVGGSDGLAVNHRSAWRSAPAPQELQSFLHVQRFEKDSIYIDFATRLDCDYYLWKADGPPDYQVIPFPVLFPDSTRDWRIRARYQGFYSGLHYVTLLLDNSRGETDTLFYRQSFGPTTPSSKAEIIMDTGFTIPDSFLATGTNFARYTGERDVSGIIVPGSGAYLDWLEVGYYRKFIASKGKLAFNSADVSGEVEFVLQGFPTADILLYDVTDSLNPVRLDVESFQITLSGSSYQLVFQDSVGSRPKRYEALTSSATQSILSFTLDSPSSLGSSGTGKDYFVICYDGFAAALSPLATHREAQGHKVELARLSDVFDEFNGGRRSPTAIRRYMEYGFANWGTPLFLFLVGDATKDYKDVLSYSSPDFLPTYLILSPVSGPTGRELVGSDHWYVSGLDGVADDFPDMYVGRIPAGSVEQVSSFVQKTIAYEAFSPDDAFRGRGLFVSDDAYSGSDWVSECFNSTERVFKTISLAARDIVVASPASPGFAADTLFLSAYLDTVPSAPKPACVNLAEMQQYTRQNVTPELMSELSKGSLFVNYQGHGNRYLLTHEYVFLGNAPLYGSDDVVSLNNYGRPALWLAFSCHVNNYEEQSEDLEYIGDCLGERLLLLPSRGAIGVFASTAFEFLPLGIHGDMNVVTFDAFFGSPPTEDLRGQRGARWLLGEVIGSAEVRFLAGDYTNQFTVQTYTLLGDPGLRMDALPPQFSVFVNGAPVSEGSGIYTISEDDSVRIQAFVSDEVAVDSASIWIEESGLEGHGTIPASDYEVTAMADTVLGTSRQFSLYYPTILRPETYDIELHALDVNNRETTFPLKVALTVSFTDVTQGAPRPIRDGSLVPPWLRLSALVTSPVVLVEDDLRFLVDGYDSTDAASVGQVDPVDGRHWRIETEVGLTDGEHVLAVGVGETERSVSVIVASGFAMRRVFVYPSPFDRVTSFNYELTGTPESVRIEVFTISGRKLVEMRGTAGVGENNVVWDGTDAEGDRVANGLYIYRITAVDAGGNKVSKLDKLVKVE